MKKIVETLINLTVSDYQKPHVSSHYLSDKLRDFKWQILRALVRGIHGKFIAQIFGLFFK